VVRVHPARLLAHAAQLASVSSAIAFALGVVTLDTTAWVLVLASPVLVFIEQTSAQEGTIEPERFDPTQPDRPARPHHTRT
jgi:hypothetical protein